MLQLFSLPSFRIISNVDEAIRDFHSFHLKVYWTRKWDSSFLLRVLVYHAVCQFVGFCFHILASFLSREFYLVDYDKANSPPGLIMLRNHGYEGFNSQGDS